MSSTPVMVGTVAGLTSASWGTTGAGTSALGIIIGARRRKDSDKAFIKNPDAFVIAQLFYNHRDEVQLQILALDAAALPDNGAAIDIVGITAALVQTSEVNYQIEAFKVFTVDATKFAALTLPA